jgi:hypothetical protein
MAAVKSREKPTGIPGKQALFKLYSTRIKITGWAIISGGMRKSRVICCYT